METLTCSINPNNLLASIECSEIIERLKTGQYFIVNDFTNKKEFHETIRETILDGIAEVESQACRRQVESAGLDKMHKHFPVDKVALLDLFIRKNTTKTIIEMTYSFCRNDLKYKGEFFIVRGYVVKITYPFSLAVKSKTTYSQYLQYYEHQFNQSNQSNQANQSKSDNLRSQLKSATRKIIKKAIDFGKPRQIDRTWHNLEQNQQRGADVDRYHHQYPYAANVFGPHLDSWYGSALNEINLWWAIAGANQDNSMVLYPELFGQPLDYDRNFAYLPAGITLPKPHRFDMTDGSILVLSSDVLHGTNLNLSDVTRIAIAPRFVLDKPKFNPNCQNLESQQWLSQWHSSEDIARGDLERITEFPMTENFGILDEKYQKPRLEKRISVTVNSPSLLGDKAITLGSSDTLAVGEKMLINFPKEKVIVCRTTDSLHAVNAICPHMQVNLIDGFHDDRHLYCPGHGVEFSWIDGKSKCDLLKLQMYQVYDQDGQIFIGKIDKIR